MGISVQIPRQARDDRKKLGMTGESSGGHKKNSGGQEGDSRSGQGGQERELVDFMRRISKEAP